MNFTYYIPLKDNENTLIKSVRIVEEKESENYIMTVYYYYMSIIFGEDKENIIFNWNKEHKLEYHQENDPLDWHIHIKVKTKEEIIEKLKKLKQLKIKDINNIKKLLNNEKIKSDNVQYQGSKNIKMYNKLKKIMKKERFDYHVIKEDIVDKKSLFLVFYFLRFSNLEFKVTPELLNKLNKNELIDIKKYKEKAFQEYHNLVVNAFNDYKKRKRKVNLEYYMNLRLTIDLAWNIITKNKLVAYFLFYKRFQNCFYLEKCNFKINLDDKLFNKMLDRVDKKLKITKIYNEQLFLNTNDNNDNNDTTQNTKNTKRGKISDDTNPNYDGGNPANVI